jgi:hypothetical protein
MPPGISASRTWADAGGLNSPQILHAWRRRGETIRLDRLWRWESGEIRWGRVLAHVDSADMVVIPSALPPQLMICWVTTTPKPGLIDSLSARPKRGPSTPFPAPGPTASPSSSSRAGAASTRIFAGNDAANGFWAIGATLVVLALIFAVLSVDSIRWRSRVVLLKLEGQLPELGWGEIARMLNPSGPYYIEDVADPPEWIRRRP